MFPYQDAKQYLINLLQENLPASIKQYAPLILELHLQEDALAMPNMSLNDFAAIKHKIEHETISLDDIKSRLVLEKANERKGIFRVLVRTHLNRSGMNHVSQGYHDKTLSPRILNFTNTIDVDADFSITKKRIVEDWLNFAIQHQNADNALKYNEVAIDALTKLKNANKEINFVNCSLTAPDLSKQLNADLGWCRIVLGVMTGLYYLNSCDWNVYHRANRNNMTFRDIDSLIKECQRNVTEYGYALSGSFFADLGSPNFVKDDIHVRNCMMALGVDGTPEHRVKLIIQWANQLGVAPRVLDKIMYIACSGRIYLLGLKLSNHDNVKAQFINYLSRFA